MMCSKSACHITLTGISLVTFGMLVLWASSSRPVLVGVYIHHATQDNTVWYDDVALSTGYIGPGEK